MFVVRVHSLLPIYSPARSRFVASVLLIPVASFRVTSEGIKIFSDSGRVYSVVAPCEIGRVWPLPTGLLLERSHLTESDPAVQLQAETDPLGSIGNPAHFRMREAEIPTFFSLMHPLEEVKPLAAIVDGAVRVSPGSNSPDSFAPHTLFCSVTSRILFSSPMVPLIVIYDSATEEHCLCLLRRDSPDDADLSYDIAKQQHDSILSAIGPKFPNVELHELVRDRDVRASLLEHEYLIRSDLFPETIQISASTNPSSGVLMKQKSTPAHHIFLTAGESASELGLCLLLPESNLLECYYISQETLLGMFCK